MCKKTGRERDAAARLSGTNVLGGGRGNSDDDDRDDDGGRNDGGRCDGGDACEHKRQRRRQRLAIADAKAADDDSDDLAQFAAASSIASPIFVTILCSQKTSVAQAVDWLHSFGALHFAFKIDVLFYCKVKS